MDDSARIAASVLKSGSHPILLSRKLRDTPVRVRALGLDLVAFRDQNGQAAVLLNRCPHRGVSLHKGSIDDQRRLVCPYHGWAFDGTGKGRSPLEPGKKNCDVQSHRAFEHMGAVWLRGDEAAPSFAVPEGYEYTGVVHLDIRAPLAVVVDNFTENEHVPLVHRNLGVSTLELSTSGFRYEVSEDAVDAEIKAPQRRTFLRLLFGGKENELFSNRWRTTFAPLKTRYVQTWLEPRSERERRLAFIFDVHFVPIDERTTAVYSFCFLRRPKSTNALLRRVMPWALRLATLYELCLDKRFLEAHPELPIDIHGLRLGMMDKPLVRIREKMNPAYRFELVQGAKREPSEALALVDRAREPASVHSSAE